jgi:hypothetical protein
MPRSGNGGFIGFADESTYGTRVAPTRFVPLISESVKKAVARLESKAIIPNQMMLTSEQRTTGEVVVSGPANFELAQAGLEVLFKHLLGKVTKTGTGPYTRLYEIDNLEGQSFSTHIARPDVGGTVRPHDFVGCKIAKAEIAATVGEIASLSLDLLGKEEEINHSVATPTYLTDAGRGFTFVNGAITIDGDAAKIKSAKWSFDNAQVGGRTFLGQPTTSEPITAEYRDYGIVLDAEFESVAHYQAYLDADIVEIVGTFTSGANTLTITETAQYDENTANIAGKGILMQSMPFKVLGSSGVSIELVNASATP